MRFNVHSNQEIEEDEIAEVSFVLLLTKVKERFLFDITIHILEVQYDDGDEEQFDSRRGMQAALSQAFEQKELSSMST